MQQMECKSLWTLKLLHVLQYLTVMWNLNFRKCEIYSGNGWIIKMFYLYRLWTGNIAVIFLRSQMEYIAAYFGQVCMFQLLYSEFILTDKTQISTSNTHLLESQFITQTSTLKALYIKMLQSTLHKCSVSSACCGTVWDMIKQSHISHSSL